MTMTIQSLVVTYYRHSSSKCSLFDDGLSCRTALFLSEYPSSNERFTSGGPLNLESTTYPTVVQDSTGRQKMNLFASSLEVLDENLIPAVVDVDCGGSRDRPRTSGLRKGYGSIPGFRWSSSAWELDTNTTARYPYFFLTE